MDVYKSDDEQIEVIRKWWDENGKSIITGIVLGLGAIFGWRAWQDYVRLQAEAASELYQNILTVIDRDPGSDEIRVIGDKIIKDYGSTAYAVFVKLHEARLAAENADYATAAVHLRWALDNNEESSVEHLIRLRLARTLVALEQYSDALSLINISDAGEFGAAYDELTGDILMQQGDLDGARDAYQLAITKRQSSNLNVSVLELKLDDLGRPAL